MSGADDTSLHCKKNRCNYIDHKLLIYSDIIVIIAKKEMSYLQFSLDNRVLEDLFRRESLLRLLT